MARPLVLLALLLAGPFVPVDARADCACVDWPPERWMGEAERVFLGRYHRRADSDGAKIYFEVLSSLKGDVPATLALDRPSESACERTFQGEELALVFVKQGRLPVCAGNFDLDKMMPTLRDYMALAGGGTPAPALDAVKLALGPERHGAKKLTVYAPALVGQKLVVGGTQVTFVDTQGETLLALSGTTRGGLSFVALRSPGAIATWLLVGRQGGKLAVLHRFARDLRIK